MRGNRDVTISTGQLVELALDMAGMSELPADSAIYIAGSGLEKLMFGIDIGPAELMLARELGCDGVIAHHPAGGSATLRFPGVLSRQIELMVEHGVPEAVAVETLQPMLTRATLVAHAANFDRTPSVARLLRMPFLNVHLPLDEVGRQLMVAAIDDYLIGLDHAPIVQDALDALLTIPELAAAETPIMVPVGAVDSPLGRLAVVHGAGTNGGAAVAEAYFAHGVGTVLYIHCGGDEVRRLREGGHGNLIVTGHISSDMIGINRYVTEIEAHGVEVVRVSGL